MRAKKSAVVIAGGPHPTAYPEETLEDGNIDFICIGEGEETFKDFLFWLKNGDSPLSSIQGLGIRVNGKAKISGRQTIKDLDSLPYPAWDLVLIDEYARRKSESPFLGRNSRG